MQLYICLSRHAEERANTQAHRARSRWIQEHGYEEFSNNYKGRPASRKQAEERWGTDGRLKPRAITAQEREAIDRWIDNWHNGPKECSEGVTELDRALWPEDYPDDM